MESKPSFWTASVKGDVYEVDWGIFENFANYYKVKSEDLKQFPNLYALSSEL